MKKIKLVLYILGILFGIFIFIYGGYDDSPGAQLLGFVIVASVITSIVRNKSKKLK